MSPCESSLEDRQREEPSTGAPALVRVKDGMSLRNGMWHGLRNDIIMRNVIYAEWLKEIN